LIEEIMFLWYVFGCLITCLCSFNVAWLYALWVS